jgi:hypothetical protein
MNAPIWRKEGRIFEPCSTHPDLASHAANPLAVNIEGSLFRVFYSGRDARNRSSVGAFDYDVANRRFVQAYNEPFFSKGSSGSFFADGVSIGNAYEAGGRRYILFMGWQNPEDAHWRGDIGRLILDDDLNLSLDGPEPFIHGDDFGEISLSYPWVHGFGPSDYHMWYGSTETWDAGNGEMIHVIKHATSPDGHIWKEAGLAIPYELGIAQAFSRPTVLPNQNGTHDMWYSYRSGDGTLYRIGHSRFNGETWSAAPGKSGIGVSDTGWDSEMIEYPFVFQHEGEVFMLYNGNGYGMSGIGLATLEP